MDGDRKNARLKQKMLKVRIRLAQSRRKTAYRLRETPSDGLLSTRKKKRSIESATPWMAPNMTKVQFAPCQSPPRSMVVRRFRPVFHSLPVLPPNGIYK